MWLHAINEEFDAKAVGVDDERLSLIDGVLILPCISFRDIVLIFCRYKNDYQFKCQLEESDLISYLVGLEAYIFHAGGL